MSYGQQAQPYYGGQQYSGQPYQSQAPSYTGPSQNQSQQWQGQGQSQNVQYGQQWGQQSGQAPGYSPNIYGNTPNSGQASNQAPALPPRIANHQAPSAYGQQPSFNQPPPPPPPPPPPKPMAAYQPNAAQQHQSWPSQPTHTNAQGLGQAPTSEILQSYYNPIVQSQSQPQYGTPPVPQPYGNPNAGTPVTAQPTGGTYAVGNISIYGAMQQPNNPGPNPQQPAYVPPSLSGRGTAAYMPTNTNPQPGVYIPPPPDVPAWTQASQTEPKNKFKYTRPSGQFATQSTGSQHGTAQSTGQTFPTPHMGSYSQNNTAQWQNQQTSSSQNKSQMPYGQVHNDQSQTIAQQRNQSQQNLTQQTYPAPQNAQQTWQPQSQSQVGQNAQDTSSRPESIQQYSFISAFQNEEPVSPMSVRQSISFSNHGSVDYGIGRANSLGPGQRPANSASPALSLQETLTKPPEAPQGTAQKPASGATALTFGGPSDWEHFGTGEDEIDDTDEFRGAKHTDKPSTPKETTVSELPSQPSPPPTAAAIAQPHSDRPGPVTEGWPTPPVSAPVTLDRPSSGYQSDHADVSSHSIPPPIQSTQQQNTNSNGSVVSMDTGRSGTPIQRWAQEVSQSSRPSSIASGRQPWQRPPVESNGIGQSNARELPQSFPVDAGASPAPVADAEHDASQRVKDSMKFEQPTEPVFMMDDRFTSPANVAGSERAKENIPQHSSGPESSVASIKAATPVISTSAIETQTDPVPPMDVQAPQSTKPQDLVPDLDPWYAASLQRYVDMLHREAQALTIEEKIASFKDFVANESRARGINFSFEDPKAPASNQLRTVDPPASRQDDRKNDTLKKEAPKCDAPKSESLEVIPVSFDKADDDDVQFSPGGRPIITSRPTSKGNPDRIRTPVDGQPDEQQEDVEKPKPLFSGALSKGKTETPKSEYLPFRSDAPPSTADKSTVSMMPASSATDDIDKALIKQSTSPPSGEAVTFKPFRPSQGSISSPIIPESSTHQKTVSNSQKHKEDIFFGGAPPPIKEEAKSPLKQESPQTRPAFTSIKKSSVSSVANDDMFFGGVSAFSESEPRQTLAQTQRHEHLLAPGRSDREKSSTPSRLPSSDAASGRSPSKPDTQLTVQRESIPGPALGPHAESDNAPADGQTTSVFSRFFGASKPTTEDDVRANQESTQEHSKPNAEKTNEGISLESQNTSVFSRFFRSATPSTKDDMEAQASRESTSERKDLPVDMRTSSAPPANATASVPRNDAQFEPRHTEIRHKQDTDVSNSVLVALLPKNLASDEPQQSRLRLLEDALISKFGPSMDFEARVIKNFEAEAAKTRREHDRARQKRQSDEEARTDELFNNNEISYADIGQLEDEFKQKEADLKMREDDDEYQRYNKDVFESTHTHVQSEIAQLRQMRDEVLWRLENGIMGRATLETPPAAALQDENAPATTLHAACVFSTIHKALETRHDRLVAAQLERNRRYRKTQVQPFYARGEIKKMKEIERQFDTAERNEAAETTEKREHRLREQFEIIRYHVERSVSENMDLHDEIVTAWEDSPTATTNDDEIRKSTYDTLKKTNEQSKALMQLLNTADIELSQAEADAAVARAKANPKSVDEEEMKQIEEHGTKQVEGVKKERDGAMRVLEEAWADVVKVLGTV